MISGEFSGSDFTEQLATINDCWLESAGGLLIAADGPEREQAKREYVLTVLARVEWEDIGVGHKLEGDARAQRLNDIYNEGQSRASALSSQATRRIALNPKQWQEYVDIHVHSRIQVKQGCPMPRSYYEALMYLRGGDAAWLPDK